MRPGGRTSQSGIDPENLLVPGTVAVFVLDTRRQAHHIKCFQERLGRQFLDVDHALHIPLSAGNQQGGCDRWYASGVGDALAVGFGEGFFVVGDVVDEHLARLAILGAFDQTPITMQKLASEEISSEVLT
jgi:hypothetical protein